MSKKLQGEVWMLDRCSGCGVCVAVCSKEMLHWDTLQHPELEERQKSIGLSKHRLQACEVCDHFCELSCPRLVKWHSHDPLGAYSVASNGPYKSGNPTNVIQSILVAALSAKLIDGVLIPDLDPWTLSPHVRIATSVEEIVDTIVAPHLWTPVLTALNEAVFDFQLRKLAIVGPPCVAQGLCQLAAVQNSRLHPYQDVIRLVLSTFCTGTYLSEMVVDLVEKATKVKAKQIKSLHVSQSSGKITLKTWKGEEHSLPLTEIEAFTRLGCNSCDDFLGEQSDLAVGHVGAKEGTSTILIESEAGEIFLENALKFGLLEIIGDIDQEAVEKARSEKNRRGLAHEHDEFYILMLEALQEPKKRALVRKHYAKLYGYPTSATKKQEKPDVTCGGC